MWRPRWCQGEHQSVTSRPCPQGGQGPQAAEAKAGQEGGAVWLELGMGRVQPAGSTVLRLSCQSRCPSCPSRTETHRTWPLNVLWEPHPESSPQSLPLPAGMTWWGLLHGPLKPWQRPGPREIAPEMLVE